MRIAIRVPNTEVLAALEPYRDGRLGVIKFIYYSNIENVETLVQNGATSGENPAELGVLISCDERAVSTITTNRDRYKNLGVKYLIHDCEKGTDNLWADPDVVQMAQDVAPLVNAEGYDFRWQIAMQFGYLENTTDGTGGDRSVCTDPNNLSTCDFAQSYAGVSWQNYNANDIFVIFGQSNNQTTPDEFTATNAPWLNYVKATYSNNAWWGISALIDKDGDGVVDFSPQSVADIAKRAREMGAEAFGVIYLGQTPAELFGPQTEMDQFLDLWSGSN